MFELIETRILGWAAHKLPRPASCFMNMAKPQNPPMVPLHVLLVQQAGNENGNDPYKPSNWLFSLRGLDLVQQAGNENGNDPYKPSNWLFSLRGLDSFPTPGLGHSLTPASFRGSRCCHRQKLKLRHACLPDEMWCKQTRTCEGEEANS